MPQEAWKQGGSWYVRAPDGTPVNLNTRQGASFVLDLLRRIKELQKPPRRRKKPGPSETK